MKNLVFCFVPLLYIYCKPSQGGRLFWLKQMEELHYPGLWKLFHIQLQRKHWRGKIFKAFFLESSFSSKVAKVTVTGSGNGLVLEMFLDQVLFKRCTTLIHTRQQTNLLYFFFTGFTSSRATTCTTSSPEKPEQGSQSTTPSIKVKYFNILKLLLFSSSLPMPEEFGMDLAPNTASSIAVQLNQVLMT